MAVDGGNGEMTKGNLGRVARAEVVTGGTLWGEGDAETVTPHMAGALFNTPSSGIP